MTYATQADMTERFGEAELIEVTDRDGTGTIGVSVLDQALADADATIDSYLQAGGYTLPLASMPPALVRIACDIARYYLYDDATNEKAPWVVRHKNALAFLRAVREGKVALGAASITEGATTGTAEIQSGGRIFGRDQGNGFI